MNLHVWLTLGVAVFGVAAFWLAMKMAERKGAAQEREQQQKDAADAIADHKKTRDDVRALARDDARDRLRQWSRD